jgi:hypothetical protein
MQNEIVVVVVIVAVVHGDQFYVGWYSPRLSVREIFQQQRRLVAESYPCTENYTTQSPLWPSLVYDYEWVTHV